MPFCFCWLFCWLLNYISCVLTGFEFPPTIVISRPSTPSMAPVRMMFGSTSEARSVPLVQNHTYLLQCERDGQAPGTLQWLRDGVVVTTSGPIRVENTATVSPDLIITIFDSGRDSGLYSCQAGSLSANVMITSGKCGGERGLKYIFWDNKAISAHCSYTPYCVAPWSSPCFYTLWVKYFH